MWLQKYNFYSILPNKLHFFLIFPFNFRQFTFIRTIKPPASYHLYWQDEANLVIVLVLYEKKASAPLTK